MYKTTAFGVLLSMSLVLPVSVPAGDVVGDIVNETAHKVFTETERRVIRDYYGDAEHGSGEANARGKGPGKNGKLPPGLQKQLEKNGQLPPGLQKKSLPAGLSGRLPPAPQGYERVIVGSDVVLVETASQVIADIITDVVLDH